jgi:Na+/proline symporter
MMLAAVHLPLWQSAPVAMLVALWAGWYWWRQGRPRVPRSRRIIRRTSMVLTVVSLPAFVRGLSVVDPSQDGALYVQTWLFAIILIAVVAISALVDAVNSVRLHAAERAREAEESAVELGMAIRQARQRLDASEAPTEPAS